MPQMPASKLKIEDQSYNYYAPETLAFGGIAKAKTLGNLPLTAKILLENLMRHLDKSFVDIEDIKRLANWTSGEILEFNVLPSSEFKISKSLDANNEEALFQIIKQLLENNKTPEVITLQNDTLMPEIVSKSESDTLIQTALCNAYGVLTLSEYSKTAAPNKYSPITFSLKAITRIALTGEPQLKNIELARAIFKQAQNINLQGAIIEFCDKGVSMLDIETRALVSGLFLLNGAQQALFPIDDLTIAHMTEAMSRKVKEYAQAIGIWHEQNRITSASAFRIQLV